MYKPFSHKKASKYYESLDYKTAKRINRAIEDMTKNPFEGRNIKRLKGRLTGKYRYALGDLRIVYRVDVEERTILIEAIGPRVDVYK